VVAAKVPAVGEFVLVELTQPFNIDRASVEAYDRERRAPVQAPAS